MPETRKEHLARCKQRALECVDRGDLEDAYTSMLSDMGKHPETEGHSALVLGAQLLIMGHLNTPDKMRKFIEDFT